MRRGEHIYLMDDILDLVNANLKGERSHELSKVLMAKIAPSPRVVLVN